MFPRMPDALPAAFELRIPTLLAFVRPVRKMVEGLLIAQEWEEDDYDDVGLILTEVVQNAIEHGSAGDGSEWVRLTCHLDTLGFTLDVIDPGTGRDPQIALDKDPTEQPPLDAARGRGLFLINRLAKQFERSLGTHGGLHIWVRKEIGTS